MGRALAALAAVLLLAAGCMAPAAAAPFRLIVTDLATPLVPNSALELAQRLGYFRREGVDVELVRVQQTPAALAALRAGAGDMADVSVSAAVQAVARGQLPLKAVMAAGKSLPFLIAARDEVATLPALKGRSFGIGRLGSLDYALSKAVLEARGIPFASLDLVSLGQPGVRAQALAAGRIDATTFSIGTWINLPDKSRLHVLLSPEDFRASAPVVNKVEVVTDATLTTRRREVGGVVRAVLAAERDFDADPARWAAAMRAARPDVDSAILDRLARAYRDEWPTDGGLDRRALAYTLDWLYRGPDFAGLKRVRLDDWVDFSLVAAAADAPTKGQPAARTPAD